MRIDHHIAIAEEFESALAKLDPVKDGQLFVWFLIQAGTQRLNEALHRLSVTSETNCETPSNSHGDFIHSYSVPLEIASLEDISPQLRNLKYLEDLRADYVRGASSLDAQTVSESLAAYDVIRAKSPFRS